MSVHVRTGNGPEMDTQLHTRRMEGMEGMPRPVLVELRVAACCERGRALASLS